MKYIGAQNVKLFLRSRSPLLFFSVLSLNINSKSSMSKLFIALMNINRIFSDRTKTLWYDERLQNWIDKVADEVQKKWSNLSPMIESNLPSLSQFKNENISKPRAANYVSTAVGPDTDVTMTSRENEAGDLGLRVNPKKVEILNDNNDDNRVDEQEEEEVKEDIGLSSIDVAPTCSADTTCKNLKFVSIIGSRTTASKLMINMLSQINKILLENGTSDLQNVHYYSDKPNSALSVYSTHPFLTFPVTSLLDQNTQTSFDCGCVHIVDTTSSKDKTKLAEFKQVFDEMSQVAGKEEKTNPRFVFFLQNIAGDPVADIAVVDANTSITKIDKVYSTHFSENDTSGPTFNVGETQGFHILSNIQSNLITLHDLICLDTKTS